jgi:hypothetical protein
MRRLPLAAQASATNPRRPVRCFAIRPVRQGFCPPETTRFFSPCGSPSHAGISAVSTLQRRVSWIDGPLPVYRQLSEPKAYQYSPLGKRASLRGRRFL